MTTFAFYIFAAKMIGNICGLAAGTAMKWDRHKVAFRGQFEGLILVDDQHVSISPGKVTNDWHLLGKETCGDHILNDETGIRIR